jgi:DNA-binding transcriptional regulator YiaG
VALLGIAQRHIRIPYDWNLVKRKPCKPLVTSIKTFGDWLQIKRQERNLTPYQLAAKMGIATALVRSWENGTTKPNPRHRQILNVLLAC